MQLQYCIKTFLRIGKCLLPSEGRFCSIDQDREKGASQSCLGGAGPQHEALAVCSPRRMYTPCMAEGRKGLRWWALKAQSPSQMAVKGHNCTPLPLFLEAQTPSPVPPWREPAPTCNIATYLPSLRGSCPPLGFAKTPGASPSRPGLDFSLLRYLFRAKATWEAEGILRPSHAGLEFTFTHFPAY